MSSRTIKLLHVEDEISQRRLLAHHLAAINDFHFEILYADAEESALDLFDSGGVELVILDYHLQQGNGLNCLEELRVAIRSCRSSPSLASPRTRSPRLSCKVAPTITSASVTSRAGCWPVACLQS